MALAIIMTIFYIPAFIAEFRKSNDIGFTVTYFVNEIINSKIVRLWLNAPLWFRTLISLIIYTMIIRWLL